MPKGVLIATPHATFGELLRLSLEESGRYVVRTVTTAQEALANGYRNGIELIILDSDLPDASVVEVGNRLRQKDPAICLVVIPPENNPRHPKLAGFTADGYLSRPFYTPVLLEMLDTLLERENLDETRNNHLPQHPDPHGQLPWLENTMLATQFLATLLLETSAHTALLMRGAQLLTCAGSLSQEVVEEASGILSRYWSKTAQRELARFLRTADGDEYLLYAVPILGNVMLGMLFDTAIRLTQARVQSLKLARVLISEPPEVKLPESQLFIESAVSEAPAPVEQQPPAEVPPFVPQPEEITSTPMAEENIAFPETPAPETSSETESPLQTLRRLLQNEEDRTAAEEVELILPPSEWRDGREEQREKAESAVPFESSEEASFADQPTEISSMIPEEPVVETEENEAKPPEMLIPEETEWVFERIEPTEQTTEKEGLPELGEAAFPEELPFVKGETEPSVESEPSSPDLPDTAILSPLELEDESAGEPSVFLTESRSEEEAFVSEQPPFSAEGLEAFEQMEQDEFAARGEDFSDADLRQLLDMLADMPTPDPEKMERMETEHPVDEWEYSDEKIAFPWEDTAANPVSSPDPDATLPVTIAGLPPESVEITRAIGVTRPVLRIHDAGEDTIPVGTRRPGQSDLPPASAYEETHQLYTCVLVPHPVRLSLSGKLAQALSQWITEICQSFGWQLENVAVYSQYLLWTVRLTPNVSPGNVVRLIRQYTAQRIFNQFPNVQYIVSGNDFWAPGYLIVRGSQPPAIGVLTEFIETAHRRQGN